MTYLRKYDAYIRLHVAILIAGGTGVFGRLITLSEVPLVFYRTWFSAILLALILVISGRFYRISGKEVLKIMGCGMLLSTHWVFFYGSIKASNVSIGVVCFALVGFFTAFIEPLVSLHKPSLREILLSLLTVAGIGLIFGFDSRYRTGIILGCISSFVYSIFTVTSRRVQRTTGENSSIVLLYELLGGAVLLSFVMPFYVHFFPLATIIPNNRDIVFMSLYVTIFTLLFFFLHLQALRELPAFTVNLSYNLEPVYSIIYAMIIFDEANELEYSFWVGVMLIVASVALQTFHKHRKT